MTIDAAAPRRTRTVALPALVAVDVATGSVINLVLNLLVAWAIFPAHAAVTLWGSPGLAIDLLPATLVPAFLMTFPVTLMLRRRLRGGLRVVPVPPAPVPLPRPLPLRALAVAALALVIVAAPTLALLVLLWPAAAGWPLLLVYKVVFSIAHAALLTPIVMLAELAGRGRPTRA